MTQPKPSGIETATAEPTTITSIVSVTGNVKPVAQANFGFQIGGVVKSIPVTVGEYVKAGDLIASLDDQTIKASLLSAQAALQEAQANLATNQTNTDINYANAKRSAVVAAIDAYNKVQNAVNSYSNSLFQSSQSANPTLLIPTQTQAQERSIENAQVGVIVLLQKWNAEVSTASTSVAETLILDSEGYMNTVTSFMNNLVAAANAYAQTSGPTQTNAAAYVATANAAKAAVSSAMSEITTAENNLVTTRPQSTAALVAQIAQAQANVANWQAQDNESRVTAPFDGIITQITPQVGDLIAANTIQFSEMSNNMYKVTVDVPETNIVGMAVGDPANITLDAFGDTVNFPATVTKIDPADTLVEGVPTYKVTLHFNQPDSRIRSGMTANIDITTDSIHNVLAIPFRSVLQGGGSTTVRVLNSNGTTWSYVPIITGLKGSDGMVQIVRGIATGTQVVTYAPGDNAS